MNFDETSINDLIENDLNYEMNEILQQSTETQQQQQHDSSHHFIFDEISTSNVLKKDCEFTNNNTNNNNSIKSESSTRYESELSEHQPTTSTTSIEAEFITFENGSLQSPSTPPPTSSSNDLSNLAWLSSVDVQQSIPKESKQQTDNNNIYQQAETSQVTGQIGSNSSNLPMIPQPQQQTNEQQQQQCEPSTSCNNYTQQQTRFAPIQPNLFGFNTNQQQVEGGGGYFTTDQPSIINYQQQHRHHRSSYRPYPPVNYRTFDNRNHRQPQKIFPKPVYSYSCLIAMSLQKSKTGALPVSDIYSFMMEKFPYFKTAPDGWKNSVRHNLSLNKCFEKVEKPNGSQRKGCLWALNPAKVNKMEEELQKWKRKDPESIRKSMSNPEEFDREMEELRRSDEEAARRRLMGLANRGLPMINPHHHQLHHHHHQQQGGVSGNFNNYQHQYSSGYHPHQLHQHQISHPHHHQQHGGGTTFQQQQQNFTFTLQQPQYQQQQSYYGSGQHDNQQSQDLYNTTPDMLTNSQQTTASSSAGGSYLDTLQSGESETNINELNDLESSLSDLTSFQTDQFFSWNDSIHQQQQQQIQNEQQQQQQEYIQPSTSGYQQTEQQIIVGNTLPSLTLPPVNNNEKDEFQLTNNNPTFSNSNSYLATNSKTVMLH